MSEVQITPSDLVEASRVHFRTSRGLLSMLGLVVVVSVVIVAFHRRLGIASDGWTALWCLVLFGLWYAAAYFVIIPLRARLTYRRHKALQRPYELSWNDEGLTTRNVNVNALTPWTDYRRWRESRNLFVLYVSDRLFHLAPKRAFGSSDAIAAFRRHLQEKIAPSPGRVR